MKSFCILRAGLPSEVFPDCAVVVDLLTDEMPLVLLLLLLET